jgi:haloalkane dehalogenase
MGFGLSDTPDSVPGTPEWHSQNLSEFIRSLDLRNITLVVHDFGGPIGLGSAIENSDRIERIVLFNSWLWETENEPQVQKIDKTINSWLGRFLYLHMNISPKVLLKKGFYDKSKLTKKVHQHYIAPFPNKESRIPLLNLAKSLKGSSAWYQQQWVQLSRLEEKDWLILWGTEDDFITTEYLQRWKERLPQAEVKEFECGHFVQEEKMAEAIKAIGEFLNGN